MANDGAGINLGDDRNVKTLEIFLRDLLRAPVGADGRKLTRHQSFDVGPAGFVIGNIGAVVSDLRIGEDNYLSSIGRIGEDFLIARQ